jgi:DNA-binding NarL/FixJ family response regulator
MFTFRAIFSNGKIRFVDPLPFPSDDDHEHEVLVTFLDPDLKSTLFEKYTQRDVMRVISNLRYGLSDKEIEVLKLAQHGFTNEQIAGQLKIGNGTVRNYLSSAYGKLEVSNRSGAIAKAIELGLLE